MPDLTERFRRLMDEFAAVTQHKVDQASGMLRELVGGTIRLHRERKGVERYQTAELTGDYSGLVRLVGGPKIKLVAVTRIERVTRGL